VQEEAPELGVVTVKFDLQLGPVVLNNHSSLSEELLMRLAIKGTSSLMNGLPYNLKNSRRFRGLLQLSEDYFVYGFDLVLIDDDSDEGNFSPIIVFLIFPTNYLPLIGSNIRSIETSMYQSTQSLLTLSHLNPDFGAGLVSSVQDILF
jgi:hypothetical protein